MKSNIMATDGEKLEVVQDFEYLGTWVNSTEADIKIQKGLPWRALNKLYKIWRSSLSRSLKICLQVATGDSVVLYGCEIWTLRERLEKQLGTCYTKMLRAALGIHWSQEFVCLMTNEEYGELSKLTIKIREKRLKFAGYCYHREEKLAPKLLLLEPSQGERRRLRE